MVVKWFDISTLNLALLEKSTVRELVKIVDYLAIMAEYGKEPSAITITSKSIADIKNAYNDNAEYLFRPERLNRNTLFYFKKIPVRTVDNI